MIQLDCESLRELGIPCVEVTGPIFNDLLAVGACDTEQLFKASAINPDGVRERIVRDFAFQDELEAVEYLRDKWPLFVLNPRPDKYRVLDELAEVDSGIARVVVRCWFEGADVYHQDYSPGRVELRAVSHKTKPEICYFGEVEGPVTNCHNKQIAGLPGCGGLLTCIDLHPDVNLAHPFLYVLRDTEGQVYTAEHSWPPNEKMKTLTETSALDSHGK